MLIILLLFALFRNMQGALLDNDVVPTDHPTWPGDDSLLLRRENILFGTRSISDITISCLATIFACTWTAIHPNIPSPTDSKWDIFKRRVVTTLYALLAPEAIMMWALRQNIAARTIAKSYNENRKTYDTAVEQDSDFSLLERIRGNTFGWLLKSPPLPSLGERVPWTITHGFFVQMGGFMLCTNGHPIQTLQYETPSTETFVSSLEFRTDSERTQTSSEILVTALFDDNSILMGNNHTFHTRLRLNSLMGVIEDGAIAVPRITEAEIQDRSKGDIISKAVVVLQTTWFVTQCIARWSTGLYVTELEVITLGFAVLNAITYALWWNKPQNVGVPVYLELNKAYRIPGFRSRGAGPFTILEAQSFFRRTLREEWEWRSSIGIGLFFRILRQVIQAALRPLAKLLDYGSNDKRDINMGDLRVPMFYASPSLTSGTRQIIYIFAVRVLTSVIFTLFGIIHLIPAWLFNYSSQAEMWSWRISAIIITAYPTIVGVLSGLFGLLHVSLRIRQTPPMLADLVAFSTRQGPILYIIARTILMTLSFLSLRKLPPSAFFTIEWIPSFPHI